MAITIDGTGTITGISAGGLPDGSITNDDLAGSITDAKLSGVTCKAWVNFNGTGTVAIRASYNVSSITDVGTGTYTINFTNALADANYAWVGSRGGQGGTLLRDDSATYITSSSIQIETRNTAGSLTDYNYIFSAVFR